MNPITAICLVLPVLACLAAPGTAQGSGDGSAKGEIPPGGKPTQITYEHRPEGVTQIMQHPNGTVSERVLQPDEVAELTRNNELGTLRGDHMFSALAHPRPRRLAPGGAGELAVIVTFAGKSVALPGDHIKLTMKPDGPCRFGQPVPDPARPGQLAGKFRGKPVYDDNLVIRIPMTVNTSVEPGKKVRVEGRLELDLHDSSSGAKIGTYFTDLAGLIPIGKPLNEQQVAARAGGRDPVGGADGPGAGAVNGTPPTDRSTRGAPDGVGKGQPRQGQPGKGDGQMERVSADRGANPADAADADPAGSGRVIGSDGSSFWIWLFGGMIGVILLLLLLAKRK